MFSPMFKDFIYHQHELILPQEDNLQYIEFGYFYCLFFRKI